MRSERVLAAAGWRGRLILLVAVVASAAGCSVPGATGPPLMLSATTGDLVPVVVSPVLAIGPNRFVFSLLDGGSNESVARPDRVATVRFHPPPGASGVHGIEAVPSDFLWAVEGVRGLYATKVDFDVDGRWTAEVQLADDTRAWPSTSTMFDVMAERPGLDVGDRAPSVGLPATSEARLDLRRVTTDVNPDPRLYGRSLADALAEHRPIIAVFGTPGFCTTGLCAPTLEAVKARIGSAPDVTFAQIEAYDLAFDGTRLQPVLDDGGALRQSEAFSTYGLVSETTVVAIDRDGVVREILDGIASGDEIEAAIARIR